MRLLRTPFGSLVRFLLFALCLNTSAQDRSVEFFHRLTDKEFFEVVTVDYDSLQTVSNMAQQMEDLGAKYFKLSERLPAPISIQLKPTHLAKFENRYFISPQRDGEMVVTIKWDEFTEYSDTCQALASAYLTRIAIYLYGFDASAAVPDWLELAFGQLLQSQLRPAYVDYQRDRVLKEQQLYLETILNEKAPFEMEQETLALNAVWLFRYLGSQLPPVIFNKMLSLFLKNEEGIDLINKAFSSRFKDLKEMEFWWAVGFHQFVRSAEAPFYHLERSRVLVRQLAFIAVELDNEGERQLAGEGLWQRKNTKALDVLIRQRVREIKLELQKINPVYFNALLSLGLTFNTLMQEDKEVFTAQYEQFLNDYKLAQDVELEIRKLLRY